METSKFKYQKGLNMKKILVLIVLPCIITSCGTFPAAHDYWKLNNQSVAYDKLEADMLACGFKNTVNNADMSNNLYIKSSLCMEKKGYLFNGKKTCDKSAYRDEIACKNIK